MQKEVRGNQKQILPRTNKPEGEQARNCYPTSLLSLLSLGNRTPPRFNWVHGCLVRETVLLNLPCSEGVPMKLSYSPWYRSWNIVCDILNGFLTGKGQPFSIPPSCCLEFRCNARALAAILDHKNGRYTWQSRKIEGMWVPDNSRSCLSSPPLLTCKILLHEPVNSCMF